MMFLHFLPGYKTIAIDINFLKARGFGFRPFFKGHFLVLIRIHLKETFAVKLTMVFFI